MIILLIFITVVYAASKNQTIVVDAGLALTYSVYFNKQTGPTLRGQWDLAQPDFLNTQWRDNYELRICLEIGTTVNYLEYREQLRWVKSIAEQNFETEKMEINRSKTNYLDSLSAWCSRKKDKVF